MSLNHNLWNQLSTIHGEQIATKNMRTILYWMETLQIAADHLERTDVCDIKGISVKWIGTFNAERTAYIECCDDGAVIAVTNDSISGIRLWWIAGMFDENGEPGVTKPRPDGLVLTLVETLEHIRCFIWADYKEYDV